MSRPDLLGAVLDALVASTDKDTLRAAVDARLGRVDTPAPTVATGSPERLSAVPAAPRSASRLTDSVLSRLVLGDILGDDILGARPADKAFPLRLFFGELAEQLDEDAGFTLAAALNFFFRAPIDEDLRMQVGLASSRLFYAFAEDRNADRANVAVIAPLLATLMSSELPRLRLESVDHTQVFDSQLHEREPGSDPKSKAVVPKSFLCRITATGMVRSRALVRT